MSFNNNNEDSNLQAALFAGVELDEEYSTSSMTTAKAAEAMSDTHQQIHPSLGKRPHPYEILKSQDASELIEDSLFVDDPENKSFLTDDNNISNGEAFLRDGDDLHNNNINYHHHNNNNNNNNNSNNKNNSSSNDTSSSAKTGNEHTPNEPTRKQQRFYPQPDGSKSNHIAARFQQQRQLQSLEDRGMVMALCDSYPPTELSDEIAHQTHDAPKQDSNEMNSTSDHDVGDICDDDGGDQCSHQDAMNKKLELLRTSKSETVASLKAAFEDLQGRCNSIVSKARGHLEISVNYVEQTFDELSRAAIDQAIIADDCVDDYESMGLGNFLPKDN